MKLLDPSEIAAVSAGRSDHRAGMHLFANLFLLTSVVVVGTIVSIVVYFNRSET